MAHSSRSQLHKDQSMEKVGNAAYEFAEFERDDAGGSSRQQIAYNQSNIHRTDETGLYERENNYIDDESESENWEQQEEAKEELGSEYERLMNEISMPPRSLRQNAALKHRQSEMPKWFPNDDKFEVKDFDD